MGSRYQNPCLIMLKCLNFQSKQLKMRSLKFWAEEKMVVDDGGVVYFDITYRLYKDCRTFWHSLGWIITKQMVVFCASLLYDESVESSMAGKKLKTILTYQDAVIAEAIDSVLPETHHRVCVWHMYEHALKQLNHVFLGSGSFVNDLSSCVFDHEEDGDFVNA